MRQVPRGLHATVAAALGQASRLGWSAAKKELAQAHTHTHTHDTRQDSTRLWRRARPASMPWPAQARRPGRAGASIPHRRIPGHGSFRSPSRQDDEKTRYLKRTLFTVLLGGSPRCRRSNPSSGAGCAGAARGRRLNTRTCIHPRKFTHARPRRLGHALTHTRARAHTHTPTHNTHTHQLCKKEVSVKRLVEVVGRVWDSAEAGEAPPAHAVKYTGKTVKNTEK